jgi:hypothetical protein
MHSKPNDPTGTTSRYGTSIKSNEMFVDLYHIKKMITSFADSIHNVDAEIKNKVYEQLIPFSTICAKSF